MTTKKTVHQIAREATRIRCNSPKFTDQSQAAASDINNIAAQFQRTGVLPQPIKIPKYEDNTNTPSLEHIFRIAQEAKLAFETLPADVRKLMDNDPVKMEAFIADDNNADLLLKYGVIEKRVTPPKSATLDDVITQLKENKKPTE